MNVVKKIIALVIAIFLVVWCAFWITIALISVLVTQDRKCAFWLARKVWAPYMLRIAGVRYEIQGLGNLDASKPQIYFMNHQSYLDIPVAFATLQSDLHFIGKKELQYMPFIGWYMIAMGMIFVDRSKSHKALASMKRAGELIRNGKSVLAFPEGTRSKDGKLGGFKKGIFLTAVEAGVPLVPVAIEGAGRLMPPGNFCIFPGKVRIAVGQPIQTTGLTAKDRDILMGQARDALNELVLNLRS